MKTYKELYSFEVLNAVTAGKAVQMVDREKCICFDVCTMTIAAVAAAVNSKEKGRFLFWYVEETEVAE